METSDTSKPRFNIATHVNLEAPAFLYKADSFFTWMNWYGTLNNESKVEFVTELEDDLSLQRLSLKQMKRLINDTNPYTEISTSLVQEAMNADLPTVQSLYLEHDSLHLDDKLAVYTFQKKVRNYIAMTDIVVGMKQSWLEHVKQYKADEEKTKLSE
jgi:hypothetical protein